MHKIFLLFSIIFVHVFPTIYSKNANESSLRPPPMECKCCFLDSFTKVCNGTIFVGEWGEGGIGCPILENRAQLDR
jgi:hypothetical protein